MSGTAVYGIERTVFSGRFQHHLYDSYRFSCLEAKMLMDDALVALGHEPTGRVERARSGGHARYGDRRIRISAGAGLAVLAHEAAHLVAYDRNGNQSDHHGAEFRRAYVELVEIMISSYHSRRLDKAFRRHYGGKAYPAVAEVA